MGNCDGSVMGIVLPPCHEAEVPRVGERRSDKSSSAGLKSMRDDNRPCQICPKDKSRLNPSFPTPTSMSVLYTTAMLLDNVFERRLQINATELWELQSYLTYSLTKRSYEVASTSETKSWFLAPSAHRCLTNRCDNSGSDSKLAVHGGDS